MKTIQQKITEIERLYEVAAKRLDFGFVTSSEIARAKTLREVVSILKEV